MKDKLIIDYENELLSGKSRFECELNKFYGCKEAVECAGYESEDGGFYHSRTEYLQELEANEKKSD